MIAFLILLAALAFAGLIGLPIALMGLNIMIDGGVIFGFFTAYVGCVFMYLSLVFVKTAIKGVLS